MINTRYPFYFQLLVHDSLTGDYNKARLVRQKAYDKFQACKKLSPYVVLIRSTSTATLGYWVETSHNITAANFIILHEHRKVVVTARWDTALEKQVFQRWDETEKILLNNIYGYKPLYGFRVKSLKYKNNKHAKDNI